MSTDISILKHQIIKSLDELEQIESPEIPNLMDLVDRYIKDVIQSVGAGPVATPTSAGGMSSTNGIFHCPKCGKGISARYQ